MSDIIRDALKGEVNAFETKEREEEARVAETKRKPSGIVPLEQRPAIEMPAVAALDRLAPVFEKHALRIAAAYDKPEELAVLQREAFAAIKKMAPLTYADDEKIIARLDALIAERAAMEAEAETVEQPAVRGIRSMPAVAAAPAEASLPEVFGLLKNMFAGSKIAEEDPLEGKAINLMRLAKQSVVEDGEDEG
ncbi:MAG: hypothetical protein V4550_18485 [Gemmatimonadota bacterium]